MGTHAIRAGVCAETQKTFAIGDPIEIVNGATYGPESKIVMSQLTATCETCGSKEFHHFTGIKNSNQCNTCYSHADFMSSKNKRRAARGKNKTNATIKYEFLCDDVTESRDPNPGVRIVDVIKD